MVLNNSLFLNVFIEDYKNNTSKSYEDNNEILINFRTANLIGDFYTNEWQDRIIKINIER